VFEYFPDNYYSWNQTIMVALAGRGNISEIDNVCRPLREISKRRDDNAQEAWHEGWVNLAQHVEGLAFGDEKAGHGLTAGRKYLRASLYYLIAERNLTHLDPRKLKTYGQALAAFKKGILLGREPVEWVEVPFQGTALPAIFVPAPNRQRAPCMIHFDGFDVMKEILYLHIGHTYRQRGVSLLIVDHPGVGEALRLRNMYVDYRTEIPAGACVDYLEGRPDIDPKRIGIVACSMGGYYAPRAAAFEKRLKCCVAWGCFWEFNTKRFTSPVQGQAEPVPAFQLLFVTGKDKLEDAIEVVKKVTLEGVMDKITCPLLVVHGENDQLRQHGEAERQITAAINSPNRKLKVFTRAEGSSEHCGVDNVTMTIDYAADWVAEVLAGSPQGV
jgi:dienelactone hydrolase